MTGKFDESDSVDSDFELYSTECTWEQGGGPSPSRTVVEAVADATGRDVNALRPLFDVVDPDALDELFEETESRPDNAADGFVTFEYEGCSVRVASTGRTVVVPQDSDES